MAEDAKDARLRMMNIVQDMKVTFEAQVEAYGVIAKLYFAKFEALKEAGFDDTQALEIIKARGLNS